MRDTSQFVQTAKQVYQKVEIFLVGLQSIFSTTYRKDEENMKQYMIWCLNVHGLYLSLGSKNKNNQSQNIQP